MLDKEPEEFRETQGLKHIWKFFYQDKLALTGFYLFLLLIITALFSQFIAPYSDTAQFIGFELLPPSWADNGKITYFFGTDDIGRDIFSRLIRGTTYTFGAALIVVLFTSILGGILGIWAGLSQGLKARVLGHFFDIFLSIPILLIAIIIATLMQPSLINAMLAITLALLPYFIHEIYQAVQQELKKEYILMLRLDGASNWQLVKETILPNIIIRYIHETSRAFIIAIIDISALSFISLGAQRPTPEWGTMIKDYIELIYLAPWATILPGVAIIITIVIVLILTNGLCKAIEKYYG
ncbi:ABC transporter permease subunit [Histophilus somni]|uniref:ABC transporter permease subunit n=1 Tax=Histophilus somni TaxID=731 RepID=UPI00109C7526|nr:ABC transporter permease subunit [Histophilus somni]QEH17827.1 ABC transporter permease subunit [Histophilus somni]THA22283.1 ABC transporter permease subunit [Histophilus somni]